MRTDIRTLIADFGNKARAGRVGIFLPAVAALSVVAGYANSGYSDPCPEVEADHHVLCDWPDFEVMEKYCVFAGGLGVEYCWDADGIYCSARDRYQRNATYGAWCNY